MSSLSLSLSLSLFCFAETCLSPSSLTQLPPKPNWVLSQAKGRLHSLHFFLFSFVTIFLWRTLLFQKVAVTFEAPKLFCFVFEKKLQHFYLSNYLAVSPFFLNNQPQKFPLIESNFDQLLILVTSKIGVHRHYRNLWTVETIIDTTSSILTNGQSCGFKLVS